MSQKAKASQTNDRKELDRLLCKVRCALLFFAVKAKGVQHLGVIHGEQNRLVFVCSVGVLVPGSLGGQNEVACFHYEFFPLHDVVGPRTGYGENTLGNEWDKKRKIGQLGTVQLDPTGPELSSRKG